MELKYYVNLVLGIIGGFLVTAYGEGSNIIEILIYMMIFDYVTGVMAGAFKKELSSEVGFKGLLKKAFILIICAVAHKIDIVMNSGGIIVNATIIFYICNEALSIVENGIKMGLPIPEKLKAAIKALKEDPDES